MNYKIRMHSRRSHQLKFKETALQGSENSSKHLCYVDCSFSLWTDVWKITRKKFKNHGFFNETISLKFDQ